MSASTEWEQSLAGRHIRQREMMDNVIPVIPGLKRSGFGVATHDKFRGVLVTELEGKK